MGKPGKYPRNDENQQFRLFETLKNCFKLSVLGHDKVEDDFAQYDTDMADIELEKVVKVDFPGFFHHVVSNIVSKNGKKYWSDVMKALDVPEVWVMAKEVIQDHKYIILALFTR